MAPAAHAAVLDTVLLLALADGVPKLCSRWTYWWLQHSWCANREGVLGADTSRDICQVVGAAHAAVLGIVPLLAPKDVAPALLQPLDALLADPGTDAEGRAALAGLLCALGGLLGGAAAERELLPRAAALADDSAFMVRKVRAWRSVCNTQCYICGGAGFSFHMLCGLFRRGCLLGASRGPNGCWARAAQGGG